MIILEIYIHGLSLHGHSCFVQVKSEGAQLLDKAHRAALKTEAPTLVGPGGRGWDRPGTATPSPQGSAPRAAESAGARAASEGAVGDGLRRRTEKNTQDFH